MRSTILIYARKMIKSGGVEKHIYTNLKLMDKEKYNFKMIIPSETEDDYYVPMLEKEGITIYKIPPHYKFFNHFKKLIKIFRENRKAVLHIHVSDGYHSIVGVIGKIFGKSKVIFHSHNSSKQHSFKKSVAKSIFRLFGDLFLAVSNDAGEFMFGKKILKNRNYRVLKNGIDINKFKYSGKYRKTIRGRLGITPEKRVLGFVGRLEQEKNLFFLLDLFESIDNDKYELIIIGEGSQLDELLAYKSAKLLNNVHFLGYIDNINHYLEAFDYFLLPSLFESLGIVLIEAQVSGLKVFASTGVSSESNVSKLICYLPLDKEVWVNKLINTEINTYRKTSYIEIEEKGYDVHSVIDELDLIYSKLVGEL